MAPEDRPILRIGGGKVTLGEFTVFGQRRRFTLALGLRKPDSFVKWDQLKFTTTGPKPAASGKLMKNAANSGETTADCCGKARRGRPQQMDPSAREAAILRATGQMLLAAPFDDVTVSSIARCAGMSKRTVYEHFKNREDLLVRAITEISRTIFMPLKAEDAKRPLKERLSLLLQINAPAGSEATKLEFLRSIIAKARTYPVLAQQLYTNGHGALTGFVRIEIARAVADGELSVPPPNLELAAEMLLSMAFEDTLKRLLHPDGPAQDETEVARRRDYAIAVFLRGCAP